MRDAIEQSPPSDGNPAIEFKTGPSGGSSFRIGQSGYWSGRPLSLDAEEDAPKSTRCAIVVDASLPAGRAANAAAVIALTPGKRHPHLAGPDLVDASGRGVHCEHDRMIEVDCSAEVKAARGLQLLLVASAAPGDAENTSRCLPLRQIHDSKRIVIYPRASATRHVVQLAAAEKSI